MLKTVVLLNIFGEIYIIFSSFFDEFEIEFFCNIINVFTFYFD